MHFNKNLFKKFLFLLNYYFLNKNLKFYFNFIKFINKYYSNSNFFLLLFVQILFYIIYLSSYSIRWDSSAGKLRFTTFTYPSYIYYYYY